MSLRNLKIFRFVFLISILFSIYVLIFDKLDIILGGIAAVEIWVFVRLHKEIRYIQDAQRLIYILENILEKMKKKEEENKTKESNGDNL